MDLQKLQKLEMVGKFDPISLGVRRAPVFFAPASVVLEFWANWPNGASENHFIRVLFEDVDDACKVWEAAGIRARDSLDLASEFFRQASLWLLERQEAAGEEESRILAKRMAEHAADPADTANGALEYYGCGRWSGD